LIGIASGLLCTFIFKQLRKLTEHNENYVLEIVLSYLFGIFSYGASELLEFSGVISVLVCGITMAHFNFYNLSQNGQLLTGYV
jgi:NhaP-type Na+/H+ or K+/H+ antiporter